MFMIGGDHDGRVTYKNAHCEDIECRPDSYILRQIVSPMACAPTRIISHILSYSLIIWALVTNDHINQVMSESTIIWHDYAAFFDILVKSVKI